MSEKFDLARMLREIGEETEKESSKSRALTQEEIKRLVAEKKKAAAAPRADAGKNQA